MPVVKGDKFINDFNQSRDIRHIIVVHNLLGRNVRSQGRVADELLVNKAIESGHQRTIGNCVVVGAEAAVELKVVAGHGVIRVIEDGVEVLCAGAPVGEAGVSKILGVAVLPVVDGVVEAGSCDTSEDVVEGTVLQDYPDNILDLGLKILDGGGGTGLVSKRSRVDLTKGWARRGLNGPGHGSNSQEGEESSRRLHTGLGYRIDGTFILGLSRSRSSLFRSVLRRTRQSFM